MSVPPSPCTDRLFYQTSLCNPAPSCHLEAKRSETSSPREHKEGGNLHLFSRQLPRPKEVGGREHTSALIGLLQQAGTRLCTVGSEGGVVVLPQAVHALNCAHDEGDGGLL